MTTDVEHQDFVNEILEHAPDSYDGDDAAEAIAIRYVHDLERDLAHWRQAAIDLGGQLELVRATLDAVVHETAREV